MSTRLFRDSVGSFGSSCHRVSGMGPRAPGDLNFIPAIWLRAEHHVRKYRVFNACDYDELPRKQNESQKAAAVRARGYGESQSCLRRYRASRGGACSPQFGQLCQIQTVSLLLALSLNIIRAPNGC